MSANSGPKIETEKEVRFAVVMYGGVSLAIYINGIAQELLRMVRSTAAAGSDAGHALPVESSAGEKGKSLRTTERVYRKISYLLSNKEERMQQWLEQSQKQKDETDDDVKKRLEALRDGWLEDASKLMDAQSAADDTIRTRFVVDIISGTSAGGINGIYLAKALANDQDLGKLQQLWIEEGDIKLLINDKQSLEEPFDLNHPPKSLLNSQRMYVKLLEALVGMEAQDEQAAPPIDLKSPPKCKSPYVEEMDLFLPTTDILGVRLPIKLADSVVYERRHRNVFHFRYSIREGCNDFDARYNPFLAYASRCTSSFPFAFEPMTLSAINEAVETFAEYQEEKGEDGTSKKSYAADSKTWERFYEKYLEPTGIQTRSVKFPERAFGDGGYLDNKPFSYAIETLMGRTADVPVDRKLIYIEPSPDHPEDRPEREGSPNAIENVMGALFSIPRYETIREDLQRILDRNRVIQRINRILRQIDEDMKLADVQNRKRGLSEGEMEDFAPNQIQLQKDLQKRQSNTKGKPLTDEQWSRLFLADMIERKGRAYAAYHRLEIGVVTDRLVAMIARIAGFNTESDHSLALLYLVRAWRDNRYTQKHDEKHPLKPTYNEFLLKFDLTYPLRRLSFVRDKINYLLRQTEDDHTRSELKSLREFISLEFNKLLDLKLRLESGRLPKDAEDILEMIGKSGIRESDLNQILGMNKQDAANGRLDYSMKNHIKDSLYERQEIECKSAGQKLLSRKSNLHKKASSPDDYLTIAEVLDAIADKVSGVIYDLKHKSDEACLNKLIPGKSQKSSEQAYAIPKDMLASLRDSYQNYDDYDMFIFPLQHGTDIGERAVVEITRISPEDATNLIDEKRANCFKLAGTALAHFGAFLEKLWRQNDILWGRFDGAERLISALLPDEPELAKRLVSEAQAAIACEEIEGKGPNEVSHLLIESMMRTKTGSPNPEALYDFICALKSGATDAGATEKLKSIDEKAIRDFYLEHYERSSQLAPQPTLRAAARATTVIGKIFEGLSDEYNRGAKAAAWVTRLGRVFWGMVEVAVPDSILNKIFRHWLKLIYLFEALMIVFGILFQNNEISRFGWNALGITMVLNAAVLLLGDAMKYRLERWRVTKTIIIGALAILMGLGLLEIPRLLPQVPNFLARLGGPEIPDKTMAQIVGLLAFIWIAISGWMVAHFNIRLKKQAEKEWEFEQKSKSYIENKESGASAAQVAVEQIKGPKIPGGFRSWLVAMEFASSKEDIDKIVGHRGDDRRETMREGVTAEFLFIGIYWLLFITMNRMLYLGSTNFESGPISFGAPSPYCALVLSVAAALTGTAAAIADIIENRRILAILEMSSKDAVEEQAGKIRRAAVLKNFMVFITVAILAITFLLRGGLISTIGYLYVLGAVWGIICLAPTLRRFIELAFFPFAAGLVMTAAAFIFRPGLFAQGIAGIDLCAWLSARKIIIIIGASVIAALHAGLAVARKPRT